MTEREFQLIMKAYEKVCFALGFLCAIGGLHVMIRVIEAVCKGKFFP